jgi:hypothetical protein
MNRMGVRRDGCFAVGGAVGARCVTVGSETGQLSAYTANGLYYLCGI